MLTCSNCLRHAIQALDLHPIVLRRAHATFASIQRPHHRRVLRREVQQEVKTHKPIKANKAKKPSRVGLRDARAREANKHHLDVKKDGEDVALSVNEERNWALRTELTYVGRDSLKLANAVMAKLRTKDPSTALELIRTSEKVLAREGQQGVDNVVSWNHVIDFYMSESKTKEAFKVFNEMKKRGHKPDAHSYTIMLRGYTMNHKNPQAVEEAMKVYDSMSRPESKLKPTIIHSNAILNCLGRALNMDSLWAVAGRLPDRGPGAPDKWTYTTILQAIERCALRDARQLAESDNDEVAANQVIAKSISEGRKLWEDIVSRWRAGDLSMDQTLVCSMGRLLLLGKEKDWNDVYSLVAQTMGISMRKSQNMDERAPPTPKTMLSAEIAEVPVLEEASVALNEFRPVDLSNRPSPPTDGLSDSPYANAGTNVLSLLTETALRLRDLSRGKMYWNKLTDPNQKVPVVPDEDNVDTYLRLLRISRSSKMVCELMENPPNEANEGAWYRRASFIIAMSACTRDLRNPHVFAHASKLLDLMETKLSKPEVKVMSMFLNLALVTTPGISSEVPGKFDANPSANNTMRAIRRLQYSDLDYKIQVDDWCGKNLKDVGNDWLDVGQKSKMKEERRRPDPPQELLDHMRMLQRAYDKILAHRSELTEHLAGTFLAQKRELTQALQRICPDPFPPPRRLHKPEGADLLDPTDKALRSERYRDYSLMRGAPSLVQDRRKFSNQEQSNTRPATDFGMWRFRRESDFATKKRRSGSRGSFQPRTHDRRDQQRAKQSETHKRASSPLTTGWGESWNKSVRDMGGSEKTKKMVVV